MLLSPLLVKLGLTNAKTDEKLEKTQTNSVKHYILLLEFQILCWPNGDSSKLEEFGWILT